MNQKLFILINALVVFFILLFFLRLKKRDEPSQLNLTGRKKEELPPGSRAKEEDKVEFSQSENEAGESRSVNVIFQYNGHSWEAFEVLGLPAGSSKSDAERAFDRILKTSDKQTHDFYRSAIQAIRRS